jgi:hypothetical protein
MEPEISRADRLLRLFVVVDPEVLIPLQGSGLKWAFNDAVRNLDPLAFMGWVVEPLFLPRKRGRDRVLAVGPFCDIREVL